MLSSYSKVFAVLLLILISGCTPTNINIYTAPQSNSIDYEVILIPDFRKTDLEWVPYDSGVVIADMVGEDLRKQTEFQVISRSADAKGFKGQSTLLVQGTVSGYVRGCKYCEYTLGKMKDKGKMSVQVLLTIKDNNTGEILADVGIDGRAKAPGHGRSKYYRVVEEILKVIDTVNNGNS